MSTTAHDPKSVIPVALLTAGLVVIDPPQPVGLGEYPLESLIPSYIHVCNTQMDYTRISGKPCPTWNSDRPLKLWYDSRKFSAPTSLVNYVAAHLDPSEQHPIEESFGMSAVDAGLVNIPPDAGTFTNSVSKYWVPVRTLLVNEMLHPDAFAPNNEGCDVVNTDIYNPDPQGATLALVKRIAVKVGA